MKNYLSQSWSYVLAWEHPYIVCVCPLAVRRGLDLTWVWTVPSPRVCWKPPPWWMAGLKFKGLEPEPGASWGFSSARDIIVLSGDGLVREGLERGVRPEVLVSPRCLSSRHYWPWFGVWWGLRACDCILVLVSLLPCCAFFSDRLVQTTGVGSTHWADPTPSQECMGLLVLVMAVSTLDLASLL